jgi:hypothetical protein
MRPTMARWRVILSSVILLGVTGLAPPERVGWRSYVNARYRYSLCYPATFRPAAEAPNGDGRRFTGPDGATLAVFGRNDVEGAGLDFTAEDGARDFAGAGGHVTYRAGRGDWRVVSGADARGHVFYAKTLRRADQFAILELHYPRAAAPGFAPIVKRLSACFAMLR